MKDDSQYKKILEKFARVHGLHLELSKDANGFFFSSLSMTKNQKTSIGIVFDKYNTIIYYDGMHKGRGDNEDSACKKYLNIILGNEIWFFFASENRSSISSYEEVVRVPSSLEELVVQYDLSLGNDM